MSYPTDTDATRVARTLSRLGYLAMGAAMVGLLFTRRVFSASPLAIGVQVVAVAIFLWARLTFGRRSFHVAADPTAGALMRSGPYRWIRHPIYTAVCLFAWAGVLGNGSIGALLLGALLAVGAVVRITCEERLLVERYPEYREYARSTSRMVPFVF
jgi:protein-S-isoprenylcysteine O-methyltransferase Ste14